jgi:ATP-dependent Clp protease protease subunit
MKKKSEFEKYATKHMGINSMVMHDYKKAMEPKMFPSGLVNASGAVISPSSMTPNIIEERKFNIAIMDVFSRLMVDRIIFLGLPIDDMVANVMVAQLLFLESTDAHKDIQVYINSPGGSVYAGLGIYDAMQYIAPEIATTNTGLCASMAFVLAVSGTKGKRSSLPHARFMQHQPLGGAEGQASDIEITAREIGKLKHELYEIISKHTGQKIDKVHTDCDRDYWMTAAEAKKYGCVDEILIGKKKK